MASQLYPKAREKFLTAQLNWLAGDYRAVLLPDGFEFDPAHEFLSDISSGARVATSELIEGRTATDGWAGAGVIYFGVLADPRPVGVLVIYRDTGIEGTSDLVAFLEAPELTGVPVTLIGLECFFIQHQLAGGLFRL